MDHCLPSKSQRASAALRSQNQCVVTSQEISILPTTYLVKPVSQCNLARQPCLFTMGLKAPYQSTSRCKGLDMNRWPSNSKHRCYRITKQRLGGVHMQCAKTRAMAPKPLAARSLGRGRSSAGETLRGLCRTSVLPISPGRNHVPDRESLQSLNFQSFHQTLKARDELHLAP